MLAARKETVLKIIVGKYISTAVPVASEGIARSYRLGVSPATIRLDMAALEEEGFILRPHHSAGGLPSDKGYRYYVEYLDEPRELALGEQHLIRDLYYQVERETREAEEWLRLTAALLRRLSRNVAMVTYPRSPRFQFKRLELIALRELKAMLVLVLSQAQLRQRVLSLDRAVSQEELTATAHKLNLAYAGQSVRDIARYEVPLDSLEERVTQLVLKIMEAEERVLGEVYITGLANLLDQPEFGSRHQLSPLVEAVETQGWLSGIIPDDEGIRVVIGQENQVEALRSCSLVLGRYGIPGGIGGVIGILGPTRMRYGQAISSIRYLKGLLSGLLQEYYA